MNLLLKNFQPLKFFNIEDKVADKDRVGISEKIFNQAGEYVFLKLIEDLSEDKINNILDSKNDQDKLNLISKYIPDLENRISDELENFRKECKIDEKY